MERDFSQTMSELRRAKGLSQRRVAAELNISQALLSHYENGAREPGLPFLIRACHYYGVSADYMLGLTDEPCGSAKESQTFAALVSELKALTERAENALKELER